MRDCRCHENAPSEVAELHIVRRFNRPCSFEQLDAEAFQVLRDRHDRIKTEIRANSATVIGVSGAVITLSLTVFEKIAPKKLYPWVLAAAWVALGFAVVVALGVLIGTTMRSIRHQDKLRDLYEGRKLTLFSHYGGGTPGGNYLYAIPQKFPGEAGTRLANVLCVAGVICAAVFAVLNLMAK